MSKAKLYYYQATGRANQIRLALAAANIDFEDVFASDYPPSPEDVSKWQSIGGNTTTNVPMLETSDGKVYTQSSAVLRAVGRMGELMPSSSTNSDYDFYFLDKILDDAEDLRSEAYKSFVTWGATKEAAGNFIEKEFPKHAGNFERQLNEKGTPFFLGDKMTVADISVYDVLVNYGTNRIPGDDCLDPFPKLKEFIQRVESNPSIDSYLKSEQYDALYKPDEATLGF